MTRKQYSQLLKQNLLLTGSLGARVLHYHSVLFEQPIVTHSLEELRGRWEGYRVAGEEARRALYEPGALQSLADTHISREQVYEQRLMGEGCLGSLVSPLGASRWRRKLVAEQEAATILSVAADIRSEHGLVAAKDYVSSEEVFLREETARYWA